MKITRYIVALVITFILEAVLCVSFLGQLKTDYNDPVKINECLKSVETNFPDESSYITSVDYTVLSSEGELLFATRSGLASSVNDAVKNNDTILDVDLSGDHGKIIIHNDTKAMLTSSKKNITITVIINGFTILTPFSIKRLTPM